MLKKYEVVTDEVKQTYVHALKGFSAEMTKQQAEELLEDENVAYVEEDKMMSFGDPVYKVMGFSSRAQNTPWGITRVGGSAPSNGRAWVIDSGIDLDHPDLNVDVSLSRSFLGYGTSPDDGHGHGTHVAGTIAAKNNGFGVIGVAAGATVVSLRVLSANGTGPTSGVLAAVDYVSANASYGDVVNMSLGGPASRTLDNAVRRAAAKGIKFSLAAGNESRHANYSSPGRTNGANIYTVSAMDDWDYWASFSNYGNPPVDYCAPGVNILSCYKNGGYATSQGTSMAAPHVAGILLLGNIVADGTVWGDPDGNADPIAHR